MDNTTEKSRRIGACIAALVLMALLLIMIIGSSYDIHAYSREPSAVSGRLEKVESWHSRYLALQVDGERYLLYKSPYTAGTFGVIMNLKRMELLPILNQKVGAEAHIEYVDTSIKQKGIVNLVIDDVKYVDKQGAVSDYLAEEKMTRGIGVVLLVLGCFLLVIKGKAG